MARMDKYEENNNEQYSRTLKNEDLYKDVYLNNTLIDLNKIMDDEVFENIEKEDSVEITEYHYEEKEYDLKKFLNDKREERIHDNLPRSLDESIMQDEDEISKLISKIEQKEKEADLFNDLLPDNEDTTILEAQDDHLNNFVSEEAINNFVMHKELDETNSFMDIDETKVLAKKKKKKLKGKKGPLIILGISFLILLTLIIYLIIKEFE